MLGTYQKSLAICGQFCFDFSAWLEKKAQKMPFLWILLSGKKPKSQKYQIFEQDRPVLWNGNVRNRLEIGSILQSTKLGRALLLCEYGAH